MKRARLAGWVVVLICLAVLFQFRTAAAEDAVQIERTDTIWLLVDSPRVDVMHDPAGVTVKHGIMHVSLAATAVLSGTPPGRNPLDGPRCPGCPFIKNPTNIVVNITLPEDDGAIGIEIIGYRIEDLTAVPNRPLVFIPNGDAIPSASPILALNLVAAGTPPNPQPPCLIPCCYGTPGPCEPAEPIEVIFEYSHNR